MQKSYRLFSNSFTNYMIKSKTKCRKFKGQAYKVIISNTIWKENSHNFLPKMLMHFGFTVNLTELQCYRNFDKIMVSV